MNNMQARIEDGLEILRREARYGKPRNWKRHAELMRRARDHVLHCGGDWERQYQGRTSREFAELMRL